MSGKRKFKTLASRLLFRIAASLELKHTEIEITPQASARG